MRTTPLQQWIAATVRAEGEAGQQQALQRYQLARIAATVELARCRSAFYRERLDGVPGPQSLAQVRRLPFTTADDLAAHGPRFVCVPQDDIARVVTLHTSGTTGPPKRVWFTPAEQELTIDFFRVGMSTFTDPGDRVLILLPCERPGSVGDLLAVALQRLGARPIRHGVVRDVAQALAIARAGAVDVMVGVPTQVLALARHDDELRLKAVLLSTDHVPVSLGRAIERAWGCQLFGHYGMTEMGLGGGVECEARRGYHLREADLYVEVVDPLTGDPVADGAHGEVVFTTLSRGGMPLVRYRTGDLGRFVPGPCPCGTWMRTLERITRRVQGLVPLQDGGRLALADLDEALFGVDAVLDFDAAVVRRSSVDRLDLDVRVTPPADEPAATDRLQRALDRAVHQVTAVRRARAGGALEVRVTVTAGGPVAPPIKRRLRKVDDDV